MSSKKVKAKSAESSAADDDRIIVKELKELYSGMMFFIMQCS